MVKDEKAHYQSVFGTPKRPVIFDFDRTLTIDNTINAILKLCPPTLHQTREFQKLLTKWKLIPPNTEEAVLGYFDFLKTIGVNRKVYGQASQEIFRIGLIRPEFIEAAEYLAKHGRSCYIASANNIDFTKAVMDEINKRARMLIFRGAIGSKASYDKRGKITGCRLAIGDKNGWSKGIRVVTKETALRKFLNVNIKQAVFFSDDIGDMKSKARYRILVTPAKRSRQILQELVPEGVVHTGGRKPAYNTAMIKMLGRFPHIATKNLARTRLNARRLSRGKR